MEQFIPYGFLLAIFFFQLYPSHEKIRIGMLGQGTYYGSDSRRNDASDQPCLKMSGRV